MFSLELQLTVMVYLFTLLNFLDLQSMMVVFTSHIGKIIADSRTFHALLEKVFIILGKDHAKSDLKMKKLDNGVIILEILISTFSYT